MSDYWKARALRAENVVRYVLLSSPRSTEKTAKEYADRIHTHIEDRYPDQIVRYTHTRIAVFQLADFCDCDTNDPEYDDWHCESDEVGEYLCSKSFLGYVCEFCDDEEGDGTFQGKELNTVWHRKSAEWPCRVIRELDEKMGRTHVD